MSLPPPGPGITGRFQTIINALCVALGWYSARDRTAIPLIEVVFAALRRRARRFAALVARIEAGEPPPPPPRHREADATEMLAWRARRTPAVPLPRQFSWLLAMLKHEGAHCHWQFRALLAEPEMVALIEGDRRVARLLRPLWWMIGAKSMPNVLRPPPRPPGPPRPKIVRRVRPAPSPPPPAPPETPRPRGPYIPGFGPPLPE